MSLTRVALGLLLSIVVAAATIVPSLVLDAQQGDGQRGRGGRETQAGGGEARGALIRRPGSDREPQFPLPNIREYKPRSTLVVPQHAVPRAKFPVIDIHSHQPAPMTAQQFDELVGSMEPLNLKVLVNSSGVSGDRLVQAMAAIRGSKHRDRMVQFTTIDFRVRLDRGSASARRNSSKRTSRLAPSVSGN